MTKRCNRSYPSLRSADFRTRSHRIPSSAFDHIMTSLYLRPSADSGFAAGAVFTRAEVFDSGLPIEIVPMRKTRRHPNPFSEIRIRIRRHVIGNDLPNQGDPLRISRTRSTMRPLSARTSLPINGFHWKCRPRTVRAFEQLSLHWRKATLF